MITVIWVYLAIVVLHGFYRAFRDEALALKGTMWRLEDKLGSYRRVVANVNASRAVQYGKWKVNERPMIYKIEQAPKCVDIHAKIPISMSEVVSIRDFGWAQEKRAMDMIVDQVLTEARKNIIIERYTDDYSHCIIFSARLRVIPPAGTGRGVDDLRPNDEGWLRAYDSMRMRPREEEASFAAIYKSLPRRG